MIADHYRAVRALLDPLPITLYDGQVPDRPAFPYVVFYMDTSNGRVTRLCSRTNRADFRFMLTSVGLSAESAMIAADSARHLVLDIRPDVAGRRCTQIRHETSIPVRADTDVTLPDSHRHPMFAVDTYHFVSYAA